MENKSIALAMVSLMALSILASGFALAESTSEISNVGDLSAGNANELSIESQDVAKVGMSKETYAQGFATSDSAGYLVNALWSKFSYLNISKNELQNIRDKYRNDPAGMQSALQELANRGIVNSTIGRLSLGAGTSHQNFKLSLASSSDSSLVFDVSSVYSDGSAGKDNVGTLTLTSKDYSQMTLWTGTLVLRSGTNAGTYSVSLASKSGIMNSNNGPGLALGRDKNEGNKPGNAPQGNPQGQGFFKNLWDKVRGKAPQNNPGQGNQNKPNPQGFGNGNRQSRS